MHSQLEYESDPCGDTPYDAFILLIEVDIGLVQGVVEAGARTT